MFDCHVHSTFSADCEEPMEKRYAVVQTNRDFCDVIREIFQVIISDGKGIELNTSGIR